MQHNISLTSLSSFLDQRMSLTIHYPNPTVLAAVAQLQSPGSQHSTRVRNPALDTLGLAINACRFTIHCPNPNSPRGCSVVAVPGSQAFDPSSKPRSGHLILSLVGFGPEKGHNKVFDPPGGQSARHPPINQSGKDTNYILL